MKLRLKPVIEVYGAMSVLGYDKRGLIVPDRTEDIKIPQVLWDAIKQVAESEEKNDPTR